MNLKIAKESNLSVRNLITTINKYEDIIFHGDFFLKDKKISKFEFNSNVPNAISLDSNYEDILITISAIKETGKIFIGGKKDFPLFSPSSYNSILSGAYFYVQKLNAIKTRELSGALNENSNRNFILNRNTINSLFYIVPMSFYKLEEDYIYTIDERLGELFYKPTLDNIKSVFKLKENQILIKINFNGEIDLF